MKKYLFSYRKKQKYFLIFGDIIALLFSVILSYLIRLYFLSEEFYFETILSKITPWLLLVILPHIFSLYVFALYNLNRLRFQLRSSIYIIFSVLLSGAIISGVFFFVPKYVFGRQVLLFHLITTSITLIIWRFIAAQFLTFKTDERKLALLGDVQMISSFMEDLYKIQNHGYNVTTICILSKDISDNQKIPPNINICNNLSDLFNKESFDVLSFDSSNTDFSNEQVRRILQLKQEGKAIYDLSSLYENITGKIPLSYIDGRWLLHSERFQGERNPYYLRFKRLIDIILSIILLIVFSPFFIIIPILIKITSKGSILFIQDRIGQNSIPFKCYKFRTMVENSEDDENPSWSSEKDPRITKIGRILRKTRLDELPQFWNILKGEMSFVGPRPIREQFANKLSEKIPFYDLRFSVKPGLSGWAQVHYDYAGSEEGQIEKFQYELFYIENMSPFLDILTIFMTMRRMLRGGGGT